MYRVVSFVSQNIPSDKQRLIFKGKVLQDDKKLSEYGNYNFLLHVQLYRCACKEPYEVITCI